MTTAYDEAASAVQPLAKVLESIQAQVIRDVRASGGRTRPEQFAARVQNDPDFAAMMSELYGTFSDNSNLLMDCVKDHVRLELLCDLEIENVDVLLPGDIVADIPEEERATYPRRVLIDRTIELFAEAEEVGSAAAAEAS